MSEQLSLFVFKPVVLPPMELPPPVIEVLNAARELSSRVRIVRGCWGIGVDHHRRWVLTGDCCCALAALLVSRNEKAEEKVVMTAMSSVSRVLGIRLDEVYSFIKGYDGSTDDDSWWFKYGRRVAQELGLS